METRANRRRFLRRAAAIGLGAWVAGSRPLAGHEPGRSPDPPPRPEDRKLVLVIFGGGTRASETMDDPQHRWIPQLWRRLVPRGTLFTNMRVEHRVVHPNANASIKTGHWEWDDLDWSRPPEHPTLFEVFRKERDAPDTAAWSFVYASILAKTGESRAKGFGTRVAANVVTPPTIPRATAEAIDQLMARAAATGSRRAEQEAAARSAELARSTSRIRTDGLRSGSARRWLDRQYRAWKSSRGTTSHDAFLARLAIRSMTDFAPEVMSVDFGEIDCAHYGSWSRYVAAIRRTDALTAKLWEAVQNLPEYRDRTLMLVLPDHGRQLDRPGSPGFVHHSDFYTNEGADEGCRRTWMLAIGPGVAAGSIVDRATPITAVAATAREYLGLEPPLAADRPPQGRGGGSKGGPSTAPRTTAKSRS